MSEIAPAPGHVAMAATHPDAEIQYPYLRIVEGQIGRPLTREEAENLWYGSPTEWISKFNFAFDKLLDAMRDVGIIQPFDEEFDLD